MTRVSLESQSRLVTKYVRQSRKHECGQNLDSEMKSFANDYFCLSKYKPRLLPTHNHLSSILALVFINKIIVWSQKGGAGAGAFLKLAKGI